MNSYVCFAYLYIHYLITGYDNWLMIYACFIWFYQILNWGKLFAYVCKIISFIRTVSNDKSDQCFQLW